MPLYRAVSRASLETGLVRRRHAHPRASQNVPSVVDNLWEALRPYGWPSRRRAVYASPTPALARERAREGADVVCEIVVADADIRIAQLPVTRACDHADVRLLRLAVERILGPLDLHEELGESGQFAPLFRTALQPDELEDFVAVTPDARAVFQVAGDCSTFWESASQTVSPTSRGELFFELIGDSQYALRPLQAF